MTPEMNARIQELQLKIREKQQELRSRNQTLEDAVKARIALERIMEQNTAALTVRRTALEHPMLNSNRAFRTYRSRMGSLMQEAPGGSPLHTRSRRAITKDLTPSPRLSIRPT